MIVAARKRVSYQVRSDWYEKSGLTWENEGLFILRFPFCADAKGSTRMEMPSSVTTGLTLKDLFDAGLHFGHQTKRWNPKMKPYIFDKRNGIHVIDLTQTVTALDEAAEFMRKTVLDGKKILFVATKKQAQDLVREAATACGQFSMTERWLGGTLTNSKTIRGSVKRMKQLQAFGAKNNGVLSVHKQENSMLRRELAKLEKNLTGIADMEEQPGALFVVDVCREINAVREAARLHIPIIAITDTNADPDPIDYVIPGNDDSVRGVEMIVMGLTNVVKAANDEYSAKVAEEAQKRAQERKAREDQEKADRQARREKAAADRKASAEAKGADALKSARAKGPKVAVASAVKQAARAAKEAAEAKAKEELAARRQEKVAAAEAAVKAAEAPQEAAPEASETPAPAAE